MASRTSINVDWQEAFTKHRTILEEHLDLWQNIQHGLPLASAARATAQTCLENTQRMIEACGFAHKDVVDEETSAGSNAKGAKRPSEEPEGQPVAKRTKRGRYNVAPDLKSDPTHVSALKDASGLFAIDSNPRNISTLLQDLGQRADLKAGKRRRSAPGSKHSSPGVEDQDSFRSSVKRNKVEHSPTVLPSAEEVDAYHRAFEAEVELRLKQKEGERALKLNKKRKRESDGVAGPDQEVVTIEGLASRPKPTQGRSRKEQRKVEMQRLFEEMKQQNTDATQQETKEMYFQNSIKPTQSTNFGERERLAGREDGCAQAKAASPIVLTSASDGGDKAPRQSKKRKLRTEMKGMAGRNKKSRINDKE